MAFIILEPTLDKIQEREDASAVTNELSLRVTGINLDAPFSRNLVLCEWVETHLVREQYHFESSLNLYSYYTQDVTAKYGPGCAFPKASFNKEIDSVLESYGLVIIKVRNSVGRGYKGLKYLNK